MSADRAPRGVGFPGAESASIESELQFFGRCPTTGRIDEAEKADYHRIQTEGHKGPDPFATTDAGSRDARFQASVGYWIYNH